QCTAVPASASEGQYTTWRTRHGFVVDEVEITVVGKVGMQGDVGVAMNGAQGARVIGEYRGRTTSDFLQPAISDAVELAAAGDDQERVVRQEGHGHGVFQARHELHLDVHALAGPVVPGAIAEWLLLETGGCDGHATGEGY